MAIPNVNQHYDLIVAKTWNGVKTDKADIAAATANVGDVIFFANGNGEGRFIYRDNDTLKSSVLFNTDIFSSYKKHTRVRTTDTKYQRKTVIIEPKDGIFNGSAVTSTALSTDVASVILTFRNFLVTGDYNTLIKDGYVQLNRSMTKGEALFNIAKSLVKSMKRDKNLGVCIYLGTKTKDASNNTTGATVKVTHAQIDAAKTASDVTLTGVDCVAIQETEMKWDLGRFYFERPNFEVSTNLIEAGQVGDTFEQAWAVDVTNNTVYDKQGLPNGRMVAEIEYASQAQRGDFLGKNGYPYNFHADGLVNPNCEYDIVVFDVAYRGDAEDVQYSPKQLFLVKEKTSGEGGDTPLTPIMTAINTYLH